MVAFNPVSTVFKLGALAAAGGAATLAAQVYRRPVEVANEFARAGMLAAGVHEEVCDAGGLPMHYYAAGRYGEPLVLLHGLGGSAENWALLLPLLSREYVVYAPDLPGFGRTPLAPEGTNIKAHVQRLKHFLDALGYARVSLVGNSFGGWIATRFAVEYPERLIHLYLLNSAGLKPEVSHSPYAPDRASARQTIRRISNYALPVPGFVLDAVVRTSRRPAYEGFIKNYDPQEELEGVLRRVQTPTTIIWGTQDRLFPLRNAYTFRDGIPNARLILLPNAGHVTQSRAPLDVARIILDDAV